jgi:hypothetical protein
MHAGATARMAVQGRSRWASLVANRGDGRKQIGLTTPQSCLIGRQGNQRRSTMGGRSLETEVKLLRRH